ncbi:MAG: response regulator transcription factor [Treponema sp.]|nr:response regulator transcription factor [Treponema sp.]
MHDTDTPTCVFIIDDHPSVRQGYKMMAEATERYTVVGLAESTEEAKSLLPSLATEGKAPSIIIVDINLKGQSGIDFVRELRRENDDGPACIVISMSIRAETIMDALAAGARGYLGKDQDDVSVIRVLDAVTRGDYGLVGSVLEAFVVGSVHLFEARVGLERSRYESLTPREKEVFRLLAMDREHDVIAIALDLSPKTIDNLRSSILSKLGVHDRLDLYRYAMKIGLIEE